MGQLGKMRIGNLLAVYRTGIESHFRLGRSGTEWPLASAAGGFPALMVFRRQVGSLGTVPDCVGDGFDPSFRDLGEDRIAEAPNRSSFQRDGIPIARQ